MLRRQVRLAVNPKAYIKRALVIKTSTEEGEDLSTIAANAVAPSVKEMPPADPMWQWTQAQKKMGENYPFSWPPTPPPTPEQVNGQPEVPTRYKPHPWYVDFERGKAGSRTMSEGNPTGLGMSDKVKVVGQEIAGMGLWKFLAKVRFMHSGWIGKGRKTLVGQDAYGNRYWQTADTQGIADRWVEPQTGYFIHDPSEIPRSWSRWLRGWAHVPPQETAAFVNWPTLTYDLRDDSAGVYWRRPHHPNYQDRQQSRYHAANPHPLNPKWENWKYTENSRFGRQLKGAWRPQIDVESRNAPYYFGASAHVSQQLRDRIYSGNYAIVPTWLFDPEFNM